MSINSERPDHINLDLINNWPAQAGLLLTRIGNSETQDPKLLDTGLLATQFALYDVAMMVLNSQSLSVWSRCVAAENAIGLSFITGREAPSDSIIEELLLSDLTKIDDALQRCELVRTIATLKWPSKVIRTVGVECLLRAAPILRQYIETPKRLTRKGVVSMCDSLIGGYLSLPLG